MLVLLLALLGVLLFLFARNLGVGGGDDVEEVPVPRVEGFPQAEAERILRDAGFEVRSVPEENDTVEEGIVFRQDPEDGEIVDEGTEVTITVSSGLPPVQVPRLVGLSQADAESQLRGLNLQPNVTQEASDDVEQGFVISQDPPEGEEVPANSGVVLVVSSGPPQVQIPDVTGQSEGSAANTLGRAGFETVSEEEPSDTIAEGQVIRTDPPRGSTAQKGSTVTMFVSSGPRPTSTTTTTSEPTVTTPSSSTTSSSTTSTTA